MNNPKNIRIGIGLLLAAAGLMVLWIAARVLVGLWIDAWWFDELGHRNVFTTMLKVRAGLWFLALLGGGAFLFLNLWGACRGGPLREGSILENFEPGAGPMDRVVRRTLGGFCAFAAIMVAVSVAKNWVEFVNFRYAEPFGIVEPVFNHDIGFYVFKLPALAYLFKMVFVLTLLAAATVSTLYYARGHLVIADAHRVIRPAAFRHLSLLGSLGVLCLAARFWVARYQLLLSRRGSVFGAGYTDIHACLRGYEALIWVALAMSAWLCFNAFRQRRPANTYVLATFAFAWFVLELAVPWGVQALAVRPNEWEREAEFIARNIDFTRRAYGLDKVEVHPWEGDEPLTAETVAQHRGTLENLLLWDPIALRDAFNQKQRIRSYYQFNDAASGVDIDRYEVGGALRPVMVSARELVHGQLPEKNRVWTNLHLQYTHGYGLCMSLGNHVGSGGTPEFLVRDIPPESTGSLQVDEPRIYYGEQTRTYALTHTRLDEFDHPGDPTNVFTRYAGAGGIPVGGTLRRALLSWYVGDKDILFTRQFTDESRILLVREVRSRVAKLAPFLSFDPDPYPVLLGGRIVWVLDGYTLTRRFPYSEPVGIANYIRNSVKATVDAYDGTVTLYRVDEDDPILAVLAKLFPSLFHSLEEMPEVLRAHLRYPYDLFRLQTLIYNRYHVEDPQVFFNGEDEWSFPKGSDGDRQSWESPRYVVMERPEAGETPEFLLTRTFTVKGKDNMIGWMAAGCDPGDYGRLFLFRFPKRRNIYGPNQAKGRFNQDPEVSRFTTLMGQLGSSVVPSHVLVVPVGEGLLYLQSLFIEDPDVKIPELKRVVLGHGDRVAMAETVDEALARLVAGMDTSAGDSRDGSTAPVFEGEAALLYEKARACLKAEDWAGFGQAFDALGSLLHGED